MINAINAIQAVAAGFALGFGWYGAGFMPEAQWAWPTIALGGILLIDAAIFRLKD